MADRVLNDVAWAEDSSENAVDSVAGFTIDEASVTIGSRISCLTGSTGCDVCAVDCKGVVGCGGFGSIITGEAGCLLIDGLVCWASGWGNGRVWADADCCVWGEGTEVVD